MASSMYNLPVGAKSQPTGGSQVMSSQETTPAAIPARENSTSAQKEKFDFVEWTVRARAYIKSKKEHVNGMSYEEACRFHTNVCGVAMNRVKVEFKSPPPVEGSDIDTMHMNNDHLKGLNGFRLNARERLHKSREDHYMTSGHLKIAVPGVSFAVQAAKWVDIIEQAVRAKKSKQAGIIVVIPQAKQIQPEVKVEQVEPQPNVIVEQTLVATPESSPRTAAQPVIPAVGHRMKAVQLKAPHHVVAEKPP